MKKTKASRPLRVMMLVHVTLVPPDDLSDPDDPRMEQYRTEYDVKQALLALGHEVRRRVSKQLGRDACCLGLRQIAGGHADELDGARAPAVP